MISVLVVNINSLKYTKNLIKDLERQTSPHQLTLVDQGSTEEGTLEYLNNLTNIHIQLNTHNVDLCRIWNWFYTITNSSLLCFLNNDIRIYPNFIEDTIEVFNKEPQVGIVVHATNHLSYTIPTELNYVINTGRFVQGWDFSIRREAYNIIPDNVKVFGGDDYLFTLAYHAGWKVATVLSSPIIHYNAASRQYYLYNRKIESQVFLDDNRFVNLPHRSPYSMRWPTWEVKDI